MSVPATTVEILLQTIGTATMIFDDPVRGVWDDVYEWAGESWNDLSAPTRSVQIRRGRSREQDKYQPASGNALIDNRDRAFDPLNVASPYLGQVQPRKQVRIRTGGISRLVGQIPDWSFSYSLHGDSTVSVALSDGFNVLSRQSVDGLAVGTATTSDRVDEILSTAGVEWPAESRNIEAGGVDLAAGTAVGNALAYLQSIEAVEAGDFFMSREGLATFKVRDSSWSDVDYDGATGYDDAVPYATPVLTPTTDLVFTDEPDDGSGTFVPYTGIQLELGTDLLYNQVIVSRGTASPITVGDDDSQSAYGVSTLNIDGSMLATDAAGTALATALVQRYRDPVVRVSEVTVNLAGLPTSVRDRVLMLDLTDVFPVRFRPNGTGARFERISRVEGVEDDIRPMQHNITFRLSGSPGT